MSNLLVISDHHFGHQNVYKFISSRTGERIRPWAESSEVGDEILINRWNSVVRKNDMVFVLGDITMKKDVSIVGRLKGRKILVRGNHDHAKANEYLKYFEDIHGCIFKPELGIMMTHIPVHTGSIMGRYRWNIHGHTHDSIVRRKDDSIDARYFNVSVESDQRKLIDIEHGVPISLETIINYFKENDNNDTK